MNPLTLARLGAALLRLTPWLIVAALGAVAWHQTPMIGPAARLTGPAARLHERCDARRQQQHDRADRDEHVRSQPEAPPDRACGVFVRRRHRLMLSRGNQLRDHPLG